MFLSFELFKIRVCCAHLMCKACYKDCHFELYILSLTKAIRYFVQAVYAKNSTYLKALEDPKNSFPDLSLEFYFDHNGFDVLQTGAFCRHS